MTGTTRDLEAELAALRASLRAVEDRVGALEAALRLAPAAPAAPPAAGAEERPAPPPTDLLRAIPLVGRLLLVLGGAYVLRALTEGGTLPLEAGSAAGFLYALAWIAAAGRAGGAGRPLSALFHAVAASLVAFPLLIETTARFEVAPPVVGAAATGLVVLAMSAVAARHDLRGVAWVATIGSVGCVLFLLLRPGGAVPYAALLVLVAAGTRRLAHARGWAALPWLSALGADAAAAFLAADAAAARGDAAPAGPAILVLAALAATHVGAVSRDVLRTSRRPGGFDVLQTALVLALGLGGALVVADATATARAPLAAAALAAGLAGYAVAFLGVRRADRAPYLYLTSVALVAVVLSSLALLPEPAVPWAALGVATSWVGSRWRRVVLSIHGAVYASAAAVASGLLHTAAHAWTAAATAPWPALDAPAALALAAVALCAWFTVRTDNPFWRDVALLPKFVSFGVLVVGGGGALVLLLAAPLAGVPGPSGTAATLSVLRTVVLSAGALGCGWVARTEHLRLARWLVYPVLLLGGVKLLAEDLTHGTPTTLAASFVSYGSALILAPRLARRRAAPAAPAARDDGRA